MNNENWILCRKPLQEKTVADNVLKWGTGGINIDVSRIEFQSQQDLDSSKPGSLNATGEHSMFGLKSGNERKLKSDIPKSCSKGESSWIKSKDDTPRAGKRTCNIFGEEKVSGGIDSPEYVANEQGRFPANFIYCGDDDVIEEFAKAGVSKSVPAPIKHYDIKNELALNTSKLGTIRSNHISDEGSPARFFFDTKELDKNE